MDIAYCSVLVQWRPLQNLDIRSEIAAKVVLEL